MMDQNPFHSWWFRAAMLFDRPLNLIGYAIALRRCSWTRSHSRLTVAFIGWPTDTP